MDTRLLFSATHSLLHKIAWQDWKHFGQPPDVSVSIVLKSVGSIFGADEVFYAIHSRTDGFEMTVDELERLDPLLGLRDFFLWDKDLKRVIEFNKIGTLRIGQINT